MPVIDYIDPVNRLVYLHADTVSSSVHPTTGIYVEYRELRRTNEALRPYNSFMKASGNESKGLNAEGQPTATERFVTLLEGTRIVPYDTSHTLNIVGTIITDDGQSGIDTVNKAPLSVSSRVDINYQPKQVEVVTIYLNGGGSLTLEEIEASAVLAKESTSQDLKARQIAIKNETAQI